MPIYMNFTRHLAQLRKLWEFLMKGKGRRHTKGGMPRQDLQTCARMKELTERIQNHIGFMGSFRR